MAETDLERRRLRPAGSGRFIAKADTRVKGSKFQPASRAITCLTTV
jgi:hypothetical protein